MTREEFRVALADVLGVSPAELGDAQELTALPAWDSLTQLSVIALFMDQFDEQPDLQQLAGSRTVADLFALAAHRLG